MTGAYARVNGLELYHEVHGAGRPLLLLHGAGMTVGLNWTAWLPELARTRRVVAVEMQGHGHTADIDRAFTLENVAGDVVGLLDHLGVDETDLFGFSLGGMAALETTLRYPERVRRVVAASTHYSRDGLFRKLPPGSRRQIPEAHFRKMRETYAAVAPFPEQFGKVMAKVAPLPGVHQWSEAELKSVQAPVLLVVGDNDVLRVEHAAEMAELIPDARLAVLPDTNHMELLDRGELVLPMVRRFLDP
jgi:pimeloyl-ACP methyl ester carboxylesterase